MANPVESDTFVGSHEKSFNNGSKTGRGQNGGQNPSSIRGTVPNIPNVSPPTCAASDAHADNTNPTRVKTDADGKAAAYATHNGMRARGLDDGSPGGTVPAANLRRDSGKHLLK